MIERRGPRVSEIRRALAARVGNYPGLYVYAVAPESTVTPCAFFQPVEWTHAEWLYKIFILLSTDEEESQDEIFHYLDPAGEFVELLKAEDAGDVLSEHALVVTVVSAKPSRWDFQGTVYHGGEMLIRTGSQKREAIP